MSTDLRKATKDSTQTTDCANLHMAIGESTKTEKEFLYRDLSYEIIGILIEIHKELGRYAREKQFQDLFDKKLKEREILYRREQRIGDSGNIIDFIVDGKIVIEFKTVAYLTEEHYNQVKRYLHQTGLKLGLLVNFREERIKPKRILNVNNLRK